MYVYGYSLLTKQHTMEWFTYVISRMIDYIILYVCSYVAIIQVIVTRTFMATYIDTYTYIYIYSYSNLIAMYYMNAGILAILYSHYQRNFYGYVEIFGNLYEESCMIT